jgi:hypothetical protein
VLKTTDSGGKLMVTHKTEAKSVTGALTGALQDLSQWYGAEPVREGALAGAVRRSPFNY